MRGARLAAAALAALALAAAGCKPSSLTPFGIGDRGPDAGQGAHAGTWIGPTTTGGAIGFQIASEEIRNLVILHVGGGCTIPLGGEVPFQVVIKDDAFVADGQLDPQGRLVVNGRFTSPDAAVGTYAFEGMLASQFCPSAGGGVFSATKQPTE